MKSKPFDPRRYRKIQIAVRKHLEGGQFYQGIIDDVDERVCSNGYRDHKSEKLMHVWFKDGHYMVCNKTNSNILTETLSPNGELTDTWIGAVLRIVGRDQELDGHKIGKIEKVVKVVTKPPSKPSREEVRAARKFTLDGNAKRNPDMQEHIDRVAAMKKGPGIRSASDGM